MAPGCATTRRRYTRQGPAQYAEPFTTAAHQLARAPEARRLHTHQPWPCGAISKWRYVCTGRGPLEQQEGLAPRLPNPTSCTTWQALTSPGRQMSIAAARAHALIPTICQRFRLPHPRRRAASRERCSCLERRTSEAGSSRPFRPSAAQWPSSPGTSSPSRRASARRGQHQAPGRPTAAAHRLADEATTRRLQPQQPRPVRAVSTWRSVCTRGKSSVQPAGRTRPLEAETCSRP
jgi:hypothetical protein